MWHRAITAILALSALITSSGCNGVLHQNAKDSGSISVAPGSARLSSVWCSSESPDSLSAHNSDAAFPARREEDMSIAIAAIPEAVFTAETLLSEVVNHTTFAGFGRYLFPIKNRSGYEGIRIGDIGFLLPYHQEISSKTTLNTLHYLVSEITSGNTVFYRFYSEEEIRGSQAKEDTGLFFFRGEPGAPFAVICAGGGFSYVGSIHESLPLAHELSKKGYNAFAIEYRTGGADSACEDLAAALSFIFANAEELQVSTADYSLWGGSAGARMAANLGSYGAGAFGGNDLPRPAAVIMQYTGHSDYTISDPPTFAVIGDRDGIASPATMEKRINALRGLGIEAEYHLYRNVAHGFGLGLGTSAEGWLDAAALFWERQIKR